MQKCECGMKIAFARYNQNTDLDYAIASVASRNTEERLGVLEALVELGHDVTIVSFVSGKHRHVLKGESLGEYDNSWMSALKWDMFADMQQFDLFIVETASANTMYSYKYEGETIGYIEHFSDLLHDACGVPICIFHVGQQELAFPFGRLNCLRGEQDAEYVKTLSPRNYRRIFQDVDVWDGYDYTLWCKAASAKEFVKSFSGTYGRPEVCIKCVSSGIGYSDRYDLALPPRNVHTAEYDLVYVGRADRQERIDKVRMYYDHPSFLSLIVGKNWNKQVWKHNGVDAPGQSKYHGDVHTHYARGLACVLVLDKEMMRCGMATTRHIQSIRSGCITMVDKDIFRGERWVGGEEFVVDNPDDVIEVLDAYCDTQGHLEEANEYQRQCLRPWTDVVPRVLDVAVGKAKGDACS